jgi:hypothetical protein
VQQEKEKELIRKAQEEENLANQESRPEVENEEITSSTPIPEVEEVILDYLEAKNDTSTLLAVQPVEEAKEETVTPDDSIVSPLNLL